jgi:hypothetical protein
VPPCYRSCIPGGSIELVHKKTLIQVPYLNVRIPIFKGGCHVGVGVVLLRDLVHDRREIADRGCGVAVGVELERALVDHRRLHDRHRQRERISAG